MQPPQAEPISQTHSSLSLQFPMTVTDSNKETKENSLFQMNTYKTQSPATFGESSAYNRFFFNISNDSNFHWKS